MWVVISLHLYAKLSLPLPSTKYLSSIKNNPKIEWDLRHWIISLYTKKKVFFPLDQDLFSKWKPPLDDLDVIRG